MSNLVTCPGQLFYLLHAFPRQVDTGILPQLYEYVELEEGGRDGGCKTLMV